MFYAMNFHIKYPCQKDQISFRPSYKKWKLGAGRKFAKVGHAMISRGSCAKFGWLKGKVEHRTPTAVDPADPFLQDS